MKILKGLLAVLVLALGVVAISSAPALAVARSSIVSVAQDELNNSSRNYQTSSECNFYTGYFRGGWKDTSGCPSTDGVKWAKSEWCADFAKYVWKKAGVTYADVAEGGPYGTLTGWARSFREYGEAHGTWHSRGSGYTPQPGDAIVFDWDGGGIDHVGLVTSANSNTVYTIEGNTDGGHTRTHSRSRSSSDIVGYSEPVGATDRPSGRVSIYGVLSDGSLSYTAMDAATGKRTHGAIHGAPLPFTPKALATLDFNTVLITDTTGKLYRINVISNGGETLVHNPPVLLGTGWTHDLLAFDSTYLYGIADGALRRYTLNATDTLTAGGITNNTLIGDGFTLKTLTATSQKWILGTTAGGALISYRINGAGSWDRYQLRDTTWQVFDHLLSPGAGVYYGHRPEGSLHGYFDANPYDGRGDDLSGQGAIDTEGWTQTLLSAQPNSASV
ncbi:CHAP domain-containing protein [Streptosporangium sp. KLBMP 9127]|nr:CHAP domain-containing protein [Streptosporangium sp. KLBMP 9127]